MKILTILMLLTMSGCSSTPYVKVGAGFKFDEPAVDWKGGGNKPVSARIEVGMESGPYTYGISHHSQWFTGWPINNDDEYYKTELFIDYTWRFSK